MNTKCQEGLTPFLFTPPPIYNKIGEELATQHAQASSARPGELGCFHLKQEIAQEHLEVPDSKITICTPFFTKYTPFAFLVILFP